MIDLKYIDSLYMLEIYELEEEYISLDTSKVHVTPIISLDFVDDYNPNYYIHKNLTNIAYNTYLEMYNSINKTRDNWFDVSEVIEATKQYYEPTNFNSSAMTGSGRYYDVSGGFATQIFNLDMSIYAPGSTIYLATTITTLKGYINNFYNNQSGAPITLYFGTGSVASTQGADTLTYDIDSGVFYGTMVLDSGSYLIMGSGNFIFDFSGFAMNTAGNSLYLTSSSQKDTSIFNWATIYNRFVNVTSIIGTAYSDVFYVGSVTSDGTGLDSAYGMIISGNTVQPGEKDVLYFESVAAVKDLSMYMNATGVLSTAYYTHGYNNFENYYFNVGSANITFKFATAIGRNIYIDVTGTGDKTIIGTTGIDNIYLDNFTGIDYIYGEGGSDTFYGDVFNYKTISSSVSTYIQQDSSAILTVNSQVTGYITFNSRDYALFSTSARVLILSFGTLYTNDGITQYIVFSPSSGANEFYSPNTIYAEKDDYLISSSGGTRNDVLYINQTPSYNNKSFWNFGYIDMSDARTDDTFYLRSNSRNDYDTEVTTGSGKNKIYVWSMQSIVIGQQDGLISTNEGKGFIVKGGNIDALYLMTNNGTSVYIGTETENKSIFSTVKYIGTLNLSGDRRTGVTVYIYDPATSIININSERFGTSVTPATITIADFATHYLNNDSVSYTIYYTHIATSNLDKNAFFFISPDNIRNHSFYSTNNFDRVNLTNFTYVDTGGGEGDVILFSFNKKAYDAGINTYVISSANGGGEFRNQITADNFYYASNNTLSSGSTYAAADGFSRYVANAGTSYIYGYGSIAIMPNNVQFVTFYSNNNDQVYGTSTIYKNSTIYLGNRGINSRQETYLYNVRFLTMLDTNNVSKFNTTLYADIANGSSQLSTVYSSSGLDNRLYIYGSSFRIDANTTYINLKTGINFTSNFFGFQTMYLLDNNVFLSIQNAGRVQAAVYANGSNSVVNNTTSETFILYLNYNAPAGGLSLFNFSSITLGGGADVIYVAMGNANTLYNLPIINAGAGNDSLYLNYAGYAFTSNVVLNAQLINNVEFLYIYNIQTTNNYNISVYLGDNYKSFQTINIDKATLTAYLYFNSTQNTIINDNTLNISGFSYIYLGSGNNILTLNKSTSNIFYDGGLGYLDTLYIYTNANPFYITDNSNLVSNGVTINNFEYIYGFNNSNIFYGSGNNYEVTIFGKGGSFYSTSDNTFFKMLSGFASINFSNIGSVGIDMSDNTKLTFNSDISKNLSVYLENGSNTNNTIYVNAQGQDVGASDKNFMNVKNIYYINTSYNGLAYSYTSLSLGTSINNTTYLLGFTKIYMAGSSSTLYVASSSSSFPSVDFSLATNNYLNVLNSSEVTINASSSLVKFSSNNITLTNTSGLVNYIVTSNTTVNVNTNSSINITGNSTALANTNVTVYLGNFNNIIRVDNTSAIANSTYISGVSVIYGGTLNDTFYNSSTYTKIYGGSGNDTIYSTVDLNANNIYSIENIYVSGIVSFYAATNDVTAYSLSVGASFFASNTTTTSSFAYNFTNVYLGLSNSNSITTDATNLRYIEGSSSSSVNINYSTAKTIYLTNIQGNITGPNSIYIYGGLSANLGSADTTIYAESNTKGIIYGNETYFNSFINLAANDIYVGFAGNINNISLIGIDNIKGVGTETAFFGSGADTIYMGGTNTMVNGAYVTNNLNYMELGSGNDVIFFYYDGDTWTGNIVGTSGDILYFYNNAPYAKYLSNITIMAGKSSSFFSTSDSTMYYYVNAEHKAEDAYFKDIANVNNDGKYGQDITYDNLGNIANTIIEDTSGDFNTLILTGTVKDSMASEFGKIDYQIKGYEVLDLTKADNASFDFYEEDIFKIASSTDNNTLTIYTKDVNDFHLLDSARYTYTYNSETNIYEIMDTATGDIAQVIIKNKS